MGRFTLYFATDIHGSERCFRKFLNAGKAYGADAVILGGDITGKALVPVIEEAGGRWKARVAGKWETASDQAELDDIERRIRILGFYAYRASPEEHAKMAADEAYQSLVFDRVMRASVEGWVDMADTRLRDAGLPCLVMPGNDDIPAVKDLLSQSSWLIQGEDHVLDFGPYQVLSFGYSTMTPWHSPRELSDEEMGRRLGGLIERIQPGRPVIFNVHNPPADSGTDLAFKLTDDMRIATAGGEPVRTPVGSRAVRAVIEQVQPVLSLHGHIHESRAMNSIGRTKVCNPGSLYPDGILQGVLISLDGDKVKGFKFVSG
jgi:Icc-related predicted phosphoesterase